MDALLMRYIHDPLYRFAVWIIFIQLMLIIGAILITAMIRWAKPKIAQRRAEGERKARQELLKILSAHSEDEGGHSLSELFEEVSIRDLITAYEQVVTRLGVVEQRALRSSEVAYRIEVYALKLTHSWLSWRRLEGALLLRSVGAVSAEERLIELLRDSSPRVAFYAAWALVRVSPRRAQSYIIEYLDTEDGLSPAQRVHLICELHLEVLSFSELHELFSSLSARLKPIMLEAVTESRHTLALPLVREALSVDEAEVRIAAYKAAATSHLGLTDKELRRGLRDPVWPVRAQAVKAVGAAKAINLIPQLCTLLSDREWWVRQNSARTLAHLGTTGLEALSYVAQFGEDRFARDVSKLVLVEVAPERLERSSNGEIKTSITPLPAEDSLAQASRIADPSASHALLTAEVTALSHLDLLSSDRK